MQNQSSYWWLTINEGAKCYREIADIVKCLEEDNPNIEYSYIYHSADEELDTNHIHMILYTKGKKKRFTTILNIFEGAHIEMTTKHRYIRCIQYLIHKNDPNKKQYPQHQIISNIPIPTLADLLNGSGYEFELFEPQKLTEYICKDRMFDVVDFINRFGLDSIHKYYFVLKDLTARYRSLDIEMRGRKQTKEEKAFALYSRTAKEEYNLSKYYYNYKGDFDDYKNQMYLDFLDSVERGLINIDQILEEEKK